MADTADPTDEMLEIDQLPIEWATYRSKKYLSEGLSCKEGETPLLEAYSMYETLLASVDPELANNLPVGMVLDSGISYTTFCGAKTNEQQAAAAKAAAKAADKAATQRLLTGGLSPRTEAQANPSHDGGGDSGRDGHGGGSHWLPSATFAHVKQISNGVHYFADLEREVLRIRPMEILIAGWELNPETMLGTLSCKTLLQMAIEWGATVIVDLFNPENPRNPLHASQDVDRQFAVLQELVKPESTGKVITVGSVTPMKWSFHQKYWVLDRKLAFVGGIDIVPSRRDDNGHSFWGKTNPSTYYIENAWQDTQLKVWLVARSN